MRNVLYWLFIYCATDMVGRENFPADFNGRLDNYKRDGTTLKVNMCLKELPKFKCLPENKGQYGTTTRILLHFYILHL